MSQSTGKTGRGVTIEVGDGESPETFTKIVNVANIAVNGRSADEVDFTHLESDGGYREQRQGFKDPGTITFDIHLNPSEDSHRVLLDLFNAGTVFTWRVNYTGAGMPWIETGQGFIQNPGDKTINPNDPIGGSVTIRCSGQSVFEAA